MSLVLREPLMLSLSSQSMSIAFLQFMCGNAVFPFYIAYVFSLLLTELCHCRANLRLRNGFRIAILSVGALRQVWWNNFSDVGRLLCHETQ